MGPGDDFLTKLSLKSLPACENQLKMLMKTLQACPNLNIACQTPSRFVLDIN